MTQPAATPANIMVVDDTIANLKLFEGILGRQGHRVRLFPRGRLALAAAAAEPPDLILMDINMPEMSGYEVCERLRAEPALAAIPVIFISALSEPLDKVRAFGCGGVDYISKPFQIEEILARVENHLKARRLQEALAGQNARLDELVQTKTRELAAANERLSLLDKAKNDFLRLIAHELRTPLHGLLGVGELLLAGGPAGPGNAELADLFQQSRARLLRILEDALLLTQMEVDTGSFAPLTFPLEPVLAQALAQAEPLARQNGQTLPAVPASLPAVSGDPQLFERALLALLETAVKFSFPGRPLALATQLAEDAVSLVLELEGPLVPAEVLPQFFTVLGLDASLVPGGEMGLSLPLAHRIFRLYGGNLTVHNQSRAGLRLTATLRAAPRPAGTE